MPPQKHFFRTLYYVLTDYTQNAEGFERILIERFDKRFRNLVDVAHFYHCDMTNHTIENRYHFRWVNSATTYDINDANTCIKLQNQLFLLAPSLRGFVIDYLPQKR